LLVETGKKEIAEERIFGIDKKTRVYTGGGEKRKIVESWMVAFTYWGEERKGGTPSRFLVKESGGGSRDQKAAQKTNATANE